MDHTGRVCEERQVFYVEDQAVNVLVMEALFRQRPRLRLIIAGSGRNACDIAPGLTPSLLLLDLRLPDCDGTSLLPRLRSRAGWEGIPAVAVTAEPEFEPTEHGFLEVWKKPLDLAAVLARLDTLLTPVPMLPWPAAVRPHAAAA